MRWTRVIATPLRLEDAIDEAAEGVIQELGEDIDLVIVFVSSAYSDHYSSLPAILGRYFPNATRFGCSTAGILENGELGDSPKGVTIMAAQLPGVQIQSFHIDGDPEDWSIEEPSDQSSEIIVLADPFSCQTSKLGEWLDSNFPDSQSIGGVASGGWAAGETILLQNDELLRTGAIGITLTGNIKMNTIVSQGCRPIGSPMFITRSIGNQIFEIDGEPAMLLLERLFASLDDADRKLAHTSLFLGLGMQDQQETYNHGDFLIRNILGIDPETRSITIAAAIEPKAIIQFHLRDSDASTVELKEQLATLKDTKPAAALVFSCMGRDKDLSGTSSHDATVLSEAMGQTPMAGFFGNGEIGPVAGKTFLHTYTTAIGFFSPKDSE